jgi:PAS domain S-box-containing protein
VINVYLVVKIKELRLQKNNIAILIQQTSEIERESFLQVVNLDDYSISQFEAELKHFKELGRGLPKNKHLDLLNYRLNRFEAYAKNSVEYIQPKMLKYLYANINQESRRAIKVLNFIDKELNQKLNEYFTYNFITMWIACGLGIVVLILSFFQIKTNRAYFKVNKLHKLLLENSIDFVMVSNSKREIVEFNKASQEAFGYTFEEVQRMGREGLFYDKNEDLKLTKALNEKGYFKGEIVNKRKNGESFITYLTANVILNKAGERIGAMGISRDITEEKKEIIRNKQQAREIKRSIEYASGLQSAALPSSEDVSALFPHHFLMYKPKDTLSGDFYLAEKVVNSESEEFQYLIIADCTGHGIPGALLSTYCNGILKASLKSKAVHGPGDILEYARTRIVQFFNSNASKNIYDGMDAAICKFDMKNKILYFSGANCCCYVIRNQKLIKLTATKQSVCYSDSPKPFQDHILQLFEGDTVYVATDGYMDQFGGPNNKKYMKKRLTALLLSISHLPVEEQGTIIEKEFNDWKGDGDQTDDVLFFAVKI